MTTLITGGTGRTGSALARLLHAANRPLLIASRSGKAPAPYPAVEFDFFKAETFENPFKADPSVDRVYIVAPSGRLDAMEPVNGFIDFAVKKGVKRFVLLSASQIEPETVPGGEIHKHLVDTGIDYTVLKPTWFIQNFAYNFVKSIKEYDQIFSATGDAKLPFVSTEDIGQAAYDSLTAEKSPNKGIYVLGPEPLSYPEAAKLLSSVLGREITYKQYTVDELANVYGQFGLPPAFAKILAGMEGVAAEGNEEKLFNGPAETKFIGKHTLLEFFEANKAIWSK